MWKPIALFFALAAAACQSTGDHDGHQHADPHHDHAAEVAAADQLDAYPLEVCTISGEPLPASGYATAMVGGRELRFCCPSCAAAAEGDPARALAEFEAAVMDSQRADYPLAVCVVSGEELGSMGEPIELLVDDTLVMVCCGGCVGPVKGNPAPFLAKLDDAR